MRKFILISLFAIVAMAASAQYVNQPVANDTVKGTATKYIYSPNFSYAGVASFGYTSVNRQTDTSAVLLQGGQTSTGPWETIDSDTNKVQTTAFNGYLFDTSGKFMYYRISKTGSVNDTARYSNQIWIFKERR